MAKILIGNYKANIYPEGNGYTGVLELGFGPDGKRNRPKRKGKNKTEVKKKLIKLVEELEASVKPDPGYRVKHAVNDFLTAFAKTDKADASKETYRNLADQHIIPRIGYTLLTDLSADDVETWLNDRAEHLATSSLGIVHGLLTRSIKRARRHDKVKRNVSTLVETPAGRPGRRSRSLSLEQAVDVLAEAASLTEEGKPKHRLGAYVIVAITTGLRTEELRTLTWRDVDLDAATVYVLRADRHKGETKTTYSRRGLGLPDLAVQALRGHRTQQAAERLRAGEAYQDHGLVFCREDGTRYTAQSVIWRFRKVLKAAGLVAEDWCPRELRHTFVSLMSDHDVPTQKISDLVGHKDTKVTEKVYRHQLKAGDPRRRRTHERHLQEQDQQVRVGRWLPEWLPRARLTT